jgi:hypothetical protein
VIVKHRPVIVKHTDVILKHTLVIDICRGEIVKHRGMIGMYSPAIAGADGAASLHPAARSAISARTAGKNHQYGKTAVLDYPWGAC